MLPLTAHLKGRLSGLLGVQIAKMCDLVGLNQEWKQKTLGPYCASPAGNKAKSSVLSSSPLSMHFCLEAKH